MAKFAHADVLDGGLNAIKNAATKILLISSYSAGNSYASVVAAKVAEATMTSGDFTIASSGNNRTLTSAVKSSTALVSAPGTPDLHFAFTDGSAKVLWVTDESSNQAITQDNVINFPALVYTTKQPT